MSTDAFFTRGLPMESSSLATTSANPPQQGEETRHPSASSVPPVSAPIVPGLDAKEMRQKVIEILSTTANGCLQELGYFPGMPAKFHELEQRAQNWQTENLKLWHDNSRLLDTIKNQNQTLAQLPGPEGEKIKRIYQLEEENRMLRAQVDKLLTTKSLMQGGQGSQIEQKYSQLLVQHKALSDSYTRACNELRRRDIAPAGSSASQQQQQQQKYSQQDHNAYLQQQQQRQTTQRPGLPPPHNQPEPQLQPASSGTIRQIPSQQMPNPHNFAHNYTRQSESMMPQQSIGHQMQAGPSSNRRASASAIVPTQLPQIQTQFHPSLQPQHMQSRPFASPTTPQHHYSSSSPKQQYPQQYQGPPINMMNQRQDPLINMMNQKHSPDSNVPSNSYPPSRLAQPTPLKASLLVPSSPATWIDSAPAHPNKPPINPAQSPHNGQTNMFNALAQNSLFAPPMPPPSRGPASASPRQVFPGQSLSSSSPLVNRPVSAPFATLSPNDTYLNRPNAPNGGPIKNPSSPVHMPTPSKSSSPAGTATTIPMNVSPASNFQSTSSLKRNSLSLSDGREPTLDEIHKKQRVEGPEPQQQRNPSGLPSPVAPSVIQRPKVHQSPIPRSSPAPVPEPERQSAGGDQENEDEEEDEEEEEVVEVGPDGLRLVSDCLKGIFGEERSGDVICKFCEFRFNNGYADQPPVPFHAPSDDQLEAHCVAEHTTAWNSARAVDD